MLQGFLLETFLQQELTHDKISIQHEDFQIYGLMFSYIYDIYDIYIYMETVFINGIVEIEICTDRIAEDLDPIPVGNPSLCWNDLKSGT